MFRGLITFVLILMISGCFVWRSFTPLSVEGAKDETIAILPVTSKQVRFVLYTSDLPDQTKVQFGDYLVGGYKKIVKYTNAVLNTLASGENNNLIGPDKLYRALENTIDAKWLHVCIDDPGPLTEPWKQEIFGEIARKLKVDRIVVVKPTVEISPIESRREWFGGESKWFGDVTVKVEMVGLSPLKLIATRTGWADFWGVWGIVGGFRGAIPFGLGKGLDRALDQATRQAFSELMKKSVQSPNVP